MPPTRSSRQNHRASKTTTALERPKPSRLTAPDTDVIVISSDEEEDVRPSRTDGIDEVIVIDSDDERSRPSERRKVQNTRTHNTHPREGKGIAPLAGHVTSSSAATSTPLATLANINAGVFGDPKTWSFGLPEPNYFTTLILWISMKTRATPSCTRTCRPIEGLGIRFCDA